MAEIIVEGASKRFGATIALEDVSLRVPDGSFVVLLGPTGAGKTTLLRLVAGLETPDQGRILIDHRDVTGAAPSLRDVTFVFQQYSLYPHLDVFDNLAFPLRAPARRVPEPEIRTRVEAVARLVRIDHRLRQPATKLSGGEMQRVAIGRALVRRPAVYLMDEPLSSLDAALRADLRTELKRIQAELGATILYVTHDQVEAMTMASHIGILERGRLVQLGTPREIYERPVHVRVAERLGSPPINLFPLGLVACPDAPAGAATVGARTEHVQLRPMDNGPARVVQVQHLGNENHLICEMAGHRLVTLTSPEDEQTWRPGDRAAVSWRRPLYFDAAGRAVQST